MTFREKLMQEHPELISTRYLGGCKGCPYHYGYEHGRSEKCVGAPDVYTCAMCWNRQMPGTETKKETPIGPNITKEDVFKLIDEAVTKKDRSISLYFGPNGMSLAIYPWPDKEEE